MVRAKGESLDFQRGLALALETLEVDPACAARFLRPRGEVEALGRRARVAWLADELLWMRQVVEEETLT